MPVPGGLAQGLGQEDGGGRDPDPGHGGQDLVKRGACTRVATSACWACRAMSWRARWGSTVAAVSVPVWRSRAETVWLAGGVASALVLLELGVDAGLAGLSQGGGGGSGGDDLRDGVVLQPGVRGGFQCGVDLGV